MTGRSAVVPHHTDIFISKIKKNSQLAGLRFFFPHESKKKKSGILEKSGCRPSLYELPFVRQLTFHKYFDEKTKSLYGIRHYFTTYISTANYCAVKLPIQRTDALNPSENNYNFYEPIV